MRDKVTFSVDGQDLELKLGGTLTAVLHQGDMLIKSNDEGVVDITPEMTVAEATKLTDEDWTWLRDEPNFKRLWGGLWPDSELPVKLESLAAKHTCGLIQLMLECLGSEKIPHLMYPETYLHPKQQRLFTRFLKGFTGESTADD